MKGRIRLAALTALAMLTPITGTAGARGGQPCRGARLRPSKVDMATVAGATLCIVNQIRRAHHLRPFRSNSVLGSIASGQSHDMAVGGYFGDYSLAGRSPFQRVAASTYGHGSRRLSVGQNIAWGQAGASTPAAIVRTWMASPPHRKILLAPLYRDVGVGISLGAPRRAAAGFAAIYTLDLAARGS